MNGHRLQRLMDTEGQMNDRRSLPSEYTTELAGPREGAEARPREIDRGAVGYNIGVRSSHGRTVREHHDCDLHDELFGCHHEPHELPERVAFGGAGETPHCDDKCVRCGGDCSTVGLLKGVVAEDEFGHISL